MLLRNRLAVRASPELICFDDTHETISRQFHFILLHVLMVSIANIHAHIETNGFDVFLSVLFSLQKDKIGLAIENPESGYAFHVDCEMWCRGEIHILSSLWF